MIKYKIKYRLLGEQLDNVITNIVGKGFKRGIVPRTTQINLRKLDTCSTHPAVNATVLSWHLLIKLISFIYNRSETSLTTSVFARSDCILVDRFFKANRTLNKSRHRNKMTILSTGRKRKLFLLNTW